MSRFKRSIKNKMEFSKKILIGLSILAVGVIIFTLIMIWRTNDLSPLNFIIPAIFTVLGTAIGFYYDKSKAENKIKLMKIYGVDPTNEDFREY